MHKTAAFYTKVTSDIPGSLWEHYVTSYLKWLYHSIIGQRGGS